MSIGQSTPARTFSQSDSEIPYSQLSGRAKANRRKARNKRRAELELELAAIRTWLSINASSVALAENLKTKLHKLASVEAELATIPPQGALTTPSKADMAAALLAELATTRDSEPLPICLTSLGKLACGDRRPA